MVGRPEEFIPDGYILLHDAMQAVGNALVEDWTGNELAHWEREQDCAAPPLVATQDAIKSEVDLSAGGITWIDREYDERLREALHLVRWPSDPDVSARLAAVIRRFRNWTISGSAPLFVLTREGIAAVPAGIVARDLRLFLEGRLDGEAVLVRAEELAGLLAGTPGSGASSSADELRFKSWLTDIVAKSPERKTKSKAELKEQYRRLGKRISQKGFERVWTEVTRDHPVWRGSGPVNRGAT
jgi:hypothetical protein